MNTRPVFFRSHNHTSQPPSYKTAHRPTLGIMQRARRRLRQWCFTLFVDETQPAVEGEAPAQHYRQRGPITSRTIDRCQAAWPGPHEFPLRYLVAQLERTKRGRLHYQIYAEFTRGVDGTILGRILAGELSESELRSIHYEPRKAGEKIIDGQKVSGRERARRYCQKEKTRVEPGFEWPSAEAFEEPQPGKRSDLAEVMDYLSTARKPRRRDLTLQYPEVVAKYPRGVAEMRSTLAARTCLYDKPPQIFVLLGPTGVSKSEFVWKWYGADLWAYPVQPLDSEWFDRYDYQRCAFFDEFKSWPRGLSITHLLRACDRYPCQLPCKGSFIDNWDPEVVCFAANAHALCDLFPSDSDANRVTTEQLYAFARRIVHGGGAVIYLWEGFDPIEAERHFWAGTGPSPGAPNGPPRIPFHTSLPDTRPSRVERREWQPEPWPDTPA